MELQVQRTPQLIAAEIRDIHRQTQKVVLYNAIEIGRRLVEAKGLLPHGEWSNWLKESVNYSQSTANNFMRIFQEYGADQITLLENNTKSPIYDRLTYSQAVALLALPEEEREEFIESHDVENMSTRELQEAIRAKEAAEKKAKEAEAEIQEYKEKVNILTAKVSQVEKEIKEEALKEKQAAEQKVKELEEKIKSLEEEVEKANEVSEDPDLEAEREKIRSELQDEMARNLEQEKKRLQIEIDQAKRELEEKNKRIKELESVGANEENQRFKVMFDQTVESFKKLLQQILKVKDSDEETGKKYAGAVEKALLTMAEEVKKYI